MGERIPTRDIIIKQNEDFEKIFYFPYDFSGHTTVEGAVKADKADTSNLFTFTGTVVPQASIAAATLALLRALGSAWAEPAVITGLKITVVRATTAWNTLQPANNEGWYDVYSGTAGAIKRRIQGKVTFDRNIKQ